MRSTTLNTAAEAPMPNAMVSTAVTEKTVNGGKLRAAY